jgi:ABC-type glycerol-3-phosphate transport system permease component
MANSTHAATTVVAHLPQRSPCVRLRRALGQFCLYSLVFASLAILLLPIAWMLSTAFKPLGDVFETPIRWIPANPTLKNFKAQFNANLGTIFYNSVVVGTASAFLATLGGAMTAYGLARFRFRGNEAVLLFFMASLAFPVPLIMISMYLLFVKISLLNTYTALVLGHTVITLPVAVWLLKSFFDALPVDVEEAAFVDGAGPFRTLFRIVLPMARPALAASAIFVFVTSWNELMFGLTFTSTTDMRPLPAGIALLFLTEFEGAWSEMMALALMVSLPILLLFLFFQKTFVRGVTAGAVKG